MAIDLADNGVVAEPHGTPLPRQTPSRQEAPEATPSPRVQHSPVPHADPWPPAIRVAVLALSVAVAWAILAGVGYLVWRAIVWGVRVEAP